MIVVSGAGRSATTYIVENITRAITWNPYPFFSDKYLKTNYYSFQGEIDRYTKVVKSHRPFENLISTKFEQKFLAIFGPINHFLTSLLKLWNEDQDRTGVLLHFENMSGRSFGYIRCEKMMLETAIGLYNENLHSWIDALNSKQNVFCIFPYEKKMLDVNKLASFLQVNQRKLGLRFHNGRSSVVYIQVLNSYLEENKFRNNYEKAHDLYRKIKLIA